MAVSSDRLSTPYRLRRRKRRYVELLMPPGVHPSATASLLKSLITFSHHIVSHARHGCRQLPQQHNLSVLSRRVEILLIFLEEVRDTTPPSSIPPSALLCFRELHAILHGMQLLSEDCVESSRTSLLMEHRRISEFFHRLTQEMATTLEILPLELLDVSCDTREQLELMRKQARRARLYVGGKEARLCAEVQSAMAQIERKEATPTASKLVEIFDSLDLRTAVDCERELDRLRVEERSEGMCDVTVSSRSRSAENREVPLTDLISFVRYCKCILFGAMEIDDEDDDTQSANAVELHEADTMKIPADFLCPISLELMRDPVIVASGQTYDRAQITRWLNGNNLTCPKSGLLLTHTMLTPNHALRNLIRQWCAHHNVRLCMPSDASSEGRRYCASLFPASLTAMEATKLTAEFLLLQLRTASQDTQRHIASEFRALAKYSSENRKVIADVGAIPVLLPLLAAEDARTKEHAVTAILNLSIFAPNKEKILKVEGAIDTVVNLMRSRSNVTDAARENATAMLLLLSLMTEAAAEMGKKEDAVKGLLEMVQEGSGRGRRDAVSALYNMSVYEPNRAKLVKAGAVRVVMEVLASAEKGMIEEEGLAMMAVLAAGDGEGREEMAVMSGAMATLVEVLQTGSEKRKENAVAVMVSLCREEQGLRASMYGALPYLQSLLFDGTPRARRKAAELLRILLR